jgi:hypothetical protein
VTSFNIADDTFIVCDPSVLAQSVVDPARTTLWWPDLQLVVTRDRGRQGVQWEVTGQWAGRGWIGTMEIWLEVVLDGVVLHHYVRLDPEGSTLSAAHIRDLTARYCTQWKRHVFALKDELEATRIMGLGAAASGAREQTMKPGLGR